MFLDGLMSNRDACRIKMQLAPTEFINPVGVATCRALKCNRDGGGDVQTSSD